MLDAVRGKLGRARGAALSLLALAVLSLLMAFERPAFAVTLALVDEEILVVLRKLGLLSSSGATTTAPAARTISTTAPLTGGGDLSTDRTFSLSGLTGLGTAYQLVGTNSGATGLANLALAGTANEVIVTPSGTTITFSTPQAIGTASSPTFAGQTVTGTLTLTGATVVGVPTWSGNQAITLSTAAQPNVTSVGTLTSLALASPLAASNGGTGLAALGPSGTVLTSTGTGYADVSIATLVSGSLAITTTTAAQPNVTSLGTLSSLTMGGTLTLGANTLALASATVSGAPTWSSNQSITLATAAQPNVTSLGTLTGLTVSGGTAAIGTFTTTYNRPILNLDETVNASATTFNLIDANMADTASANSSSLLTLRKSGTIEAQVWKNGQLSTALYSLPETPGTSGYFLQTDGAGATHWASITAGGSGGVTSITGTANQVVASASTGAVTLSTPQSIGTSSTPQFSALGLGGAAGGANTLKLYGSSSGSLTMQATAATTAYTVTWPAAVASAGQVLSDTAGNGVLSWVTQSVSATTTTITNNTATSFDAVTVASNSATGGQVAFYITCTDSTDYQALSGVLSYAMTNKGGTLGWSVAIDGTNPASASCTAPMQGSAGTLSAFFDATGSGSTITIRCTATSSLTPTTFSLVWKTL